MIHHNNCPKSSLESWECGGGPPKVYHIGQCREHLSVKGVLYKCSITLHHWSTFWSVTSR